MKKLTKILLALCVFLCGFSVSANAEVISTNADEQEEKKQLSFEQSKPFDYEESELVEYSKNIFNQVITYNENGLKYAVENSTGNAKEVYETYLGYVKNDTLGEFEEYTDSKVTVDKESVIVDLVAKYEKTDLTVSITFQDLGTGVGAVKINLETNEKTKSMSESLKDAAANTVMGLATVFMMLLFISFIISRFKYIAVIQEKMSQKKADKNIADIDSLVALDNAVSQIESREELVDDTELVAVITAAICAATNKSGDSFVVRSIRKRK